MESNNISIKPKIIQNKIVSIEVGKVLLPLKEELSFNELPKLIEAVEVFFKYVDVSQLGETLAEKEENLKQWTEKELYKFVSTQLKDGQKAALKILVDSGEVTREEFIEKMQKIVEDKKFNGWRLGGLLAGITMRSKSWGEYETLYGEEWRTMGDEGKYYYFLRRPEYKNIIAKALKEET